MSQFKGQGDPDMDELVPSTPIVIQNRLFNPSICINSTDPDGHHNCVHNWQFYWGNQKRGG